MRTFYGHLADILKAAKILHKIVRFVLSKYQFFWLYLSQEAVIQLSRVCHSKRALFWAIIMMVDKLIIQELCTGLPD